MSARIIRFDDHHPAFANVLDIPPIIGMQIYRGGEYIGAITTQDRIEAFSRDWDTLGEFGSLDAAAAALIAKEVRYDAGDLPGR